MAEPLYPRIKAVVYAEGVYSRIEVDDKLLPTSRITVEVAGREVRDDALLILHIPLRFVQMDWRVDE